MNEEKVVDNTVKFLINDYADREALAKAFACSGYPVYVEVEEIHNTISRKYYVCVIMKGE